MADEKEYFDTSLYAAQAKSLADFSEAPNLKTYGGNLHLLHVTVAMAKVGNTDILRLAILPHTAKVIPALSKVCISEGLGVTMTIDVGTETAPQTYAKTLVVTNAGSMAFDAVHNASGQAVTPVKAEAKTVVQARVNTAVDAKVADDSEATLTFFIVYTLA